MLDLLWYIRSKHAIFPWILCLCHLDTSIFDTNLRTYDGYPMMIVLHSNSSNFGIFHQWNFVSGSCKEVLLPSSPNSQHTTTYKLYMYYLYMYIYIYIRIYIQYTHNHLSGSRGELGLAIT